MTSTPSTLEPDPHDLAKLEEVARAMAALDPSEEYGATEPREVQIIEAFGAAFDASTVLALIRRIRLLEGAGS